MEQFGPICLYCCHYATHAFVDKRMKICTTLSFMRGGMAQVWAANETSAILDNMSSFGTLAEFFGIDQKDLRQPRLGKDCSYTATCTKDDTGYDSRGYMASFEMPAAWTSFNEAALVDMYICGLPKQSF